MIVALAPEKQFPTPLRQAVLALNHLLAAGCSPSKVRRSNCSLSVC
jgi:hypothetical protein